MKQMIGAAVASSCNTPESVLRLTVANVEALLYRLPVNADPAERRSLETWRDRAAEALASLAPHG
jgi:hypothetical protein